MKVKELWFLMNFKCSDLLIVVIIYCIFLFYFVLKVGKILNFESNEGLRILFGCKLMSLNVNVLFL